MKNAWKVVIIIMALAIVALILAAVSILSNLECSHPNKPMNNPSQGFQMDYQIDLKQDRYIIIDESGDRHVVVLGDLEQFFLRDNL